MHRIAYCQDKLQTGLTHVLSRHGFHRQASHLPGSAIRSTEPDEGAATPASGPPQVQLSTGPNQELALGNELQQPSRQAYFFREEHSGLVATGNFMTLAVRPACIEEGEWLAHQVSEQFRLLGFMLDMLQVADPSTGHSICNSVTCPTMSASKHVYYWLDREKSPVSLPANKFVQLLQRWIAAKLDNPACFPTGPVSHPGIYQTVSAHYAGHTQPLHVVDWLGKSSGFPEQFAKDIRNIYRQMMRCYAHIYHAHWVEPFWHLSAYKELNTCFIHFANVGILHDLLTDSDLEPMRPLLDIWREKGWLSISHSKHRVFAFADPGQSATSMGNVDAASIAV